MYTCLPKEPTWKRTAARWHYLTSPNTQTIIHIIDIYWDEMNEKKKNKHVHADRWWVNVICLRITFRFRFLTSLSEWMERLLLNIRKMEEGFNLSQIGHWVWRALSSHSSMANRHILKQCITDFSWITSRHKIWMLWTRYHSEHFGNAPVLLVYLCRVHFEYLFSLSNLISVLCRVTRCGFE